MALGDEQIDRLTQNLDAVAKARIAQLSNVFDQKIESIRELLNGLSFGVVAAQVKKPLAANPPTNEDVKPTA